MRIEHYESGALKGLVVVYGGLRVSAFDEFQRLAAKLCACTRSELVMDITLGMALEAIVVGTRGDSELARRSLGDEAVRRLGDTRLARWAGCDGEWGLSALSIYNALRPEGYPVLHEDVRDRAPADADDLRRCILLVDLADSDGFDWTARIGELATASPAWSALAPRWGEAVALWCADDGEGLREFFDSLRAEANA